MLGEYLLTEFQAREIFQVWLRDLDPELRRRISAAGVEMDEREGRRRWIARVALLPDQSPGGFPAAPQGLSLQFESYPAFRTLV